MPAKFWHEWLHFDLLSSTNNYLKEAARAGRFIAPTLVQADAQTQGRGQFDRRWASPAGGLYLSLLLFPQTPVERWSELSLLTVKVLKNCLETAGLDSLPPLRIKLPNDLYVGERKLAGVLLETETPADWVVVGVGLNVVRSKEMPLKVAALSDWCDIRPAHLLNLFASLFQSVYQEWESSYAA